MNCPELYVVREREKKTDVGCAIMTETHRGRTEQ